MQKRWYSKAHFYGAALAGSLASGNQLLWFPLRAYWQLPQAEKDAYLWGTRSSRASDPIACRYKLNSRDVDGWTAVLLRGGYKESELSVWQMAPDDRLTLQGEVCRLPGGYYLRYSTERGRQMREAMRDAKEAFGLTALSLLRGSLCERSMAFIEETLDLSPDCVIEFTAYDHHVGRLKWNTIIWEIREY